MTESDGRTRRRDATRRKIFEAAVALIAEQGFSGTTVDEIADRAGVAKGTVFYNFASKTALYEELLRYGVGLLAAESRSAIEGLPPREAIAALIGAQLSYIQRYRAFAQLLLAEMWRTNREWQQTILLVREQAISVIVEVLEAGVASGEFPPELDPRISASALFGAGLVVALDWLLFSPERPVEEVQAGLLAVLRTRPSL
ncbi:TetR/AcrR family transcriptional regulator [Hamadaea tsunoensis]|uniref:TetR/AcrR family transcriptional regulator n=1 Tax=Hamadaea tsunoensis TaxID=53368 RepID=UPI0003F8F9BE|nr:TetR/AcrR family transcriptional regulator [Hamadaea tsunoensis]